MSLSLDPRATALVLIDLQNGIVERPAAPRSGADALAASMKLAERFRAAGAPVVLVNVAFSDPRESLAQPVDEPMPRPEGGFPAGWSELVPGLAHAGDILVTKRQWGAFYGTQLELVLRRRGVRSIVLGGIATNFGVESTARQAWELGFEVVIAEDTCTTRSAELHELAIRHIFPRIARVRPSADIAFS